MVDISKVNPADSLRILQKYMHHFIDVWPEKTMPFNQFFKIRYPELLPGTKEWARSVATHCYYCYAELSKSGTYNNQTATIDHFEPKSKSPTRKFVISCAHCNISKADMMPDALVRKFITAEIKGLSLWGFSGKKLKSVSERVQAINNDRLWKMGPNVYFIQR